MNTKLCSAHTVTLWLFRVLGLVLILALLAGNICQPSPARSVGTGEAATQSAWAKQATSPPAGLFTPDGTLNLATDYRGSVDGRGWRLVSRPGEVSRFAPLTASSDENWADGFVMNGVDGPVYALAVADGNLYVGGRFATAGGVLANNIAKWNGSGWSALGSGVDDYVYALAVDGGNLYVGGNFTTAGGVSANHIARWDGSDWLALGSGMASGYPSIDALVLDGSGNLYVGGHFYTAGGVPANHIAIWNGSSWKALGGGIAGPNPHETTVYALAVSAGGSNVYAGGNFTTAGGMSANCIALWNGSHWSALGSGMGGSVPRIDALAVDGSGDVYAGGGFTTAGGKVSTRFAHWTYRRVYLPLCFRH